MFRNDDCKIYQSCAVLVVNQPGETSSPVPDVYGQMNPYPTKCINTYYCGKNEGLNEILVGKTSPRSLQGTIVCLSPRCSDT